MTTADAMAADLTGWCVGGPLDGRQVTVRSAPFLAADKAAGTAWIYKRQPDGRFAVCTDHDDSLNYPHGPQTGERAIDWDRLPLSTDAMAVVSLGSSPEAYAGDPVDDGWVDGERDEDMDAMIAMQSWSETKEIS
jgi:hypothetical protein